MRHAVLPRPPFRTGRACVFGTVAGVALLAITAARADVRTANDVLKLCRDSSPLKQSICVSYLQGLADGMQVTAIGLPNLCMPHNLDRHQLVDAAIAVLKQVPAAEDDEAVAYVAPAFARQWPCRAPQGAGAAVR